MKKIIYLAVVVLTVYLNIMYKWPFGVKVLATELIFPLICILMAFFMKMKIDVKLGMAKDVAEQGEELPIQMTVENRSAFPTMVKITVACQYAAEQKTQKNSFKVYVDGRKNVTVDSRIIAEYCGKLEFRVLKIKVYDCWGFFSASGKRWESQSFIVMPKPFPVNLTVSSKTKWFPIDGESYARDRGGDDSAEIYEVREYRAGDRMQKVHWKLSAKEDSLYIKEFSYPLGAAVILMLEGGKAGGRNGASVNQFIESVVSVSLALLEQECAHYIVWRTKNDETIQKVLIQNEEEFYTFMLRLLEFTRDSLESEMEEYYRYEYKNETYSTIVKISTDLFMQINNQEPMDMMEQGGETFFEKTEIVV